jgi:hypothetical protein
MDDLGLLSCAATSEWFSEQTGSGLFTPKMLQREARRGAVPCFRIGGRLFSSRLSRSSYLDRIRFLANTEVAA